MNEILGSPSIKLSMSNTIVLDGTETGVLLKDFLQHLKRKDATRPDIYLTLFYFTWRSQYHSRLRYQQSCQS